MKKIVIASTNKGKIREFKVILEPLGFKVLGLDDLKYQGEIVEDGKTFKENAAFKAKAIANAYNEVCIADDSGLEVFSLNNAPGIYSARYSKSHCDDDNNALLIKNLEGYEDRRARYVCAICLYTPAKEVILVEDYCYGEISLEPKGSGGFGYDPYFFLPEYGCTMAEMPLTQKNKISHRAKALNKLLDKLNEEK